MSLTAGQQQCVDTLDRSLVVAAGAGSGKTFTLTQRIAGAFESKSGAAPFVTDIDEICAITFTKKAAGELKSRIKAELRARNLVDQALRVDEAWISTIHGMCARILRAHAVELGIDPAFKVVEGPQLEEYQAQAIEAVLAEAEYEDSPRLDALFAEYKVRSFGSNGSSVESMLKTLVEAASAQADGIDSVVMPGATLEFEVVALRAIEIAEEFLADAEGEAESPKRDVRMAEASEALDNAHAVVARGIDGYEAALQVVEPLRLMKDFGSKDFKARVDEARIDLATCIMEARLGVAQAHLETLVRLAQRALEKFSELKHADGALGNNDLLVLAARAIEEHPDIAAQYADKFKLVMVDEFQDTDQMQVDMIKRLTGEGAQRLCTVGDAQQSIYRFRGADVSVFRRHLESVRSADEEAVIELADNFRSHADVLAFVDRVFEKPGMFGGEFMSLTAKREEAKVAKPFSPGLPRITVQHTSRPYSGYKGVPAVNVAAARIADAFAEFAEAGHKPGEMVVLLRKLKNADVFAQALRDKGLPCIVSGGSVFADMPEARLVEQLTRVIANPLETQPLFNVLISPLFALTAGDLLSIGGVEGFLRVAYGGDGDDSMSPQLASAVHVMGSAFGHIGVLPVARILDQVFTDSGWLSRKQLEGPEGLASAANALKAIRMVDAIERSGAMGPASVAWRYADTLEHSKESPGALSVSGGDSVRIMTIHSSKGLEFPIVAVGELGEGRAPGEKPLLISSLSGSVFVSLKAGNSASSECKALDDAKEGINGIVLGDVADEDGLACAVAEDAGALHRRLALKEYQAIGDEEEAKRLLYVALTRAKEALVISSVGAHSKTRPLGIPKGVLAGVFEALDPAGAGFGVGRTTYDFGGSMPAVLEYVKLENGDEADMADTADTQDDQTPREEEGSSFMVPAAEASSTLVFEPYKPLHQGIFSYSSISDASHKGDLLDRLADAFAVSVDEGTSSEDAFESAGDELFEPASSWASFDDDFWDFDITAAFDEDRATDLGTAFHRLAQYAVVSREGEGPLAMPPSERIEALSRTCNLDGLQRARLDEALARWFGSAIAWEMAALPNLSAEVPFFVSVPCGNSGDKAYLEGEIDLLGFDEPRSHAAVVDYKTGGRDDESADDLRRKHVLQAACYAYAIMLQGVAEVDAVFVRVERPQADSPSEPQCVRYHFESKDVPALAHAIEQAYALSK